MFSSSTNRVHVTSIYCLSYLDVQQVRQLLGLVMSVTASCVCDKYHRKQKVVVSIQQLLESSSSSGNYRSATEQDAVDVKQDAHLTGDRQVRGDT